MPTILLINDNKIVSRLLQLSSQKHDYKLEEINDYTAGAGAYNVVFVDSEKYDAEAFEALKDTLTFDKLGYIGDKANEKPQGFDLILEKPFLPTDFVNLMSENFKVMPEGTVDEPEDEILDLDTMVDLEEDTLDDLEEMEVDEELESLDELVADEPEEETPAVETTETELTTGIVNNFTEESGKEELASLVDEIEDMPVKEMDLDELVDEKVSESLAEIEEEEESSDNISEGVLAGVATAAVAAAVSSASAEEESEEELADETLNVLEGVESIESEDDYLKESENKVQDLADEFDSLNEAEVEKLMSGEEIVSEEFAEEEEKVVESSDLEEMITRAVSKAITKEMLQEALKDMEITITLNAKKSE